MSDLLFDLVQAIIVVAIGLVVRYLVPWIKSQIEGTKLKEIINWSYKFVEAAEQIFGSGKGADKKDYVTKMLKKLLTAKKLALSEEQINALIEGIVNEMYPKKGDNS